MNNLFWIILAALVILAGMRLWSRVKRDTGSGVRPLTDEEIRRLEEGGSIEIDPPTDLDEVAEAEERFWGEGWDEPDEPFR